MSSVFIVLVLVSFQVFCDGAPGRISGGPALRRLPWYASRGKFQEDKRTVNPNTCLQAHNAKRKLHFDTSPLVWDATLAQHAQSWANRLASEGKMYHSSAKKGEGENLYTHWSTDSADATCEEAVDEWYNEIKDYKFNNPRFSGKTGHFTQVVWRGTTSVGVGVATTTQPDSEGFYQSVVVARYSPPGNYEGQFASNVGAKL